MDDIKTSAFSNFRRQVVLVDQLLVAARENESKTEIELWAAYSVGENDNYKEDCIYKEVQKKRKESLLKVPEVISKLNELENELELEMTANYISNNKTAFTKYVDIVVHTFCEHLNVNSHRLFKTKYSLFVEDGVLTDEEEEKKTILLRDLPFRLIEKEKINSYDLAAWFYITMQANYERFVNEHNFLINSEIAHGSNKRLKLEAIFKPGYFEKCQELFEHLEITIDGDSQLSEGKGAALLRAAIDAMMAFYFFNIEKPKYSKILPYFNSYLDTSYLELPKTGVYEDQKAIATEFLNRQKKK